MRNVLKSRLTAGILILTVVCLGIVFAGDVIVKEGIGLFDKIGIGTTSPSEALDLASGNLTTTGTIEGGVFKSTGCTATGTKAVALGYKTEASGDYSTAMGSGALVNTTASGDYSTAMGHMALATGEFSTAIGTSLRAGPASYTTAIGKSFINDVQYSFAVGFGNKDFAVSSGQANVYGDLDVSQKLTVGTLVLPSSSSDPGSAVQGQIYYRTNDHKVRVYSNGQWKSLAWEE